MECNRLHSEARYGRGHGVTRDESWEHMRLADSRVRVLDQWNLRALDSTTVCVLSVAKPHDDVVWSTMRCPKCGCRDDKVIDSRASREGAAIRRRRECISCGHRYTTYEEVERGRLMVLK